MALPASPVQLLSGPSFQPARLPDSLLVVRLSYSLQHQLSSPYPPDLGPHFMHNGIQLDLLIATMCLPSRQTYSQMMKTVPCVTST